MSPQASAAGDWRRIVSGVATRPLYCSGYIVDNHNRFAVNAPIRPVGGPALCHAERRVTNPSRLLDPEVLGDHLDRLYRAAWALCGRREDAEDLVQETYARVLAKPRFLRRDDDLGYLLRVMHNVFVSGLRSARSRPQTVELDLDRDQPADP